MRAWRCIGVIVALIVVAGVVGVAFIYSGMFNVSASYPDSHMAEWVLSTTMDNSVKRHAKGIEIPNLDDPAMITKGLSHYRLMCVGCHGAPGVEIEGPAKGLNPEPPEMAEAAGDWKPNELFWITKNGVRMSGMMGWGNTHTDKEIWAIVAFVKKLPSMKPEEYKAMSAKAPAMRED